MIVCEGSNCSKCERCRRWLYNARNVDITQCIDFSTTGLGTIGIDGCCERWDCGDLSRGYPLYEEMDKNELPLRTTIFIIQAKDEDEKCRFYSGSGELTERIVDSLFFSSLNLAEDAIAEFDEPENFEIRGIHITLEGLGMYKRQRLNFRRLDNGE